MNYISKMRKLLKGIVALLIPVAYVFMGTGYAQDIKTDPVAENMLLFQRSVGGWPKAVNEKPVNYNRTLSESERKSTLSDAGNDDATMDNNATHKEIVYLINAYKQTNNPAYLQSVEKGILKVSIKNQQKSAVAVSGRVLVIEFSAISEGSTEIGFNNADTKVNLSNTTSVLASGHAAQVVIGRDAVASSTNDR